MTAPTYEQKIDAWLSDHNLPRGCPACESDQRRIDFNPPRAGDWHPVESFKKAGTPIDRIEITCLSCASVRVFDAGVMGIA